MTSLPENIVSDTIDFNMKDFLFDTYDCFSNQSRTMDNIKVSVHLIQNVPATKEAVLEYFHSIFYAGIKCMITDNKKKQVIFVMEESIMEIYKILSKFINENPKPWSSMISSWAFDLLGTISYDFSKLIDSKQTMKMNSALQYWMSCGISRMLVDLAVQSLQSLSTASVELCIEKLIYSVITDNPYISWLVAHVGNCFPTIVINQILSCSLKKLSKSRDVFKLSKSYQTGSLLDVLDYLSCNHFNILKKSVVEIFNKSINDTLTKPDLSDKDIVIPYLIQLATLSPIILEAVANSIVQIINSEMILRLFSRFENWKIQVNANIEAMTDMGKRLILNCERDGLQILSILAGTIPESEEVPLNEESNFVISVCSEVLESTVEEIELCMRRADAKKNSLPFFKMLKQNLNEVITLFLSNEPYKTKMAARILNSLGFQNPNFIIAACSQILSKSRTRTHLSAFIWLVTSPTISSDKNLCANLLKDQDFFPKIVEQALRELQYTSSTANASIEQLYNNLLILLEWEYSTRVNCLRSKCVSRSVFANLTSILAHLMESKNYETKNCIVKVLHLWIMMNKEYLINSLLIYKLVASVMIHLSETINNEGSFAKIKRYKLLSQIIKQISNHFQFVRILALRETFELSILNKPISYSGFVPNSIPNEQEPLLLHYNHKQGTGAILAQRHSSVFHAGIIGRGPRLLATQTNSSQNYTDFTTTLLIDMIKVSSMNQFNPHDTGYHPFTSVSLLLVELVSPDVMYNGLPWPDEEFTKVTVERDLKIQRLFKDYPILWRILQLIAWYRPAVAYCSVLLRAILATQLTYNDTKKMAMAINVMSLGQFLPTPLNRIIDFIDQLKTYQVAILIKDCIWLYMQENVPSPALFPQSDCSTVAWRDMDNIIPNIRYLDILRLTLIVNMRNLGFLYRIIFYKS
ncbi:integrator complex subunit 5 [Trichogramma pretiosum]|uniref:integrator complex subunit 5 n=1 Tax=Trichogramma pretiosum TaxID=7493 RepID=UPI0006C9C73A|nr:integrator complex subunit 5 [Trichogramma pretiosum]